MRQKLVVSAVGFSAGYPDGRSVGPRETGMLPAIPASRFEAVQVQSRTDRGRICEPGPTGTWTFVFYSDLSPAPIDRGHPPVVDKHSSEHCGKWRGISRPWIVIRWR